MAELVIRWVTPLDPNRLKDPNFVRALDTIANNPGGNPLLPFERLPMVHFANIIVIEKKSIVIDKKSRPIAPVPIDPPLLVFESNIDEPLKEYVHELVDKGRAGLDLLYQRTPGYSYPPPGSSDEEVAHFFLQRRLKRGTHLYHIGHPNRTVQEIRGDFELRRSIAHELDTDPALRKLPPVKIIQEIRRRARAPYLWWFWKRKRPWTAEWANGSPNLPTPLGKIDWEKDTWSWLKWAIRTATLVVFAWLVAAALIVLVNPVISPKSIIALLTVTVFVLVRANSGEAPLLRNAVLTLGFGALLYFPFQSPAVLRWITTSMATAVAVLILIVPVFLFVSYVSLLWRLMTGKPLEVPPWVRDETPKLMDAEDRPENSHYNHVAGLSELKPGRRWFRAMRTLLVMELLNLFYRTQYVKGKLVTIPSIHFAQWSLVDSRYLLFLTNYDGPADSYLDDFFNTLALGVAFIWHETEIFPNSVDPRRLKLWVREGQTLARVRYRNPVYDGLTVAAINNNTYIRKRLLTRPTASGARRWLRRFAVVPEEPTVFSRVSGWLREFAAGVRG
jgi:hypothetical protein